MNKLLNIAELARVAFGETAQICFYGPRGGGDGAPFGSRSTTAIVCKLHEPMPELDTRRKLFASIASNALGRPVRVSVFTSA
ncbi:MAG: hypothetical protein HY749_23100 [Gammaproteobacteria bacterium]|nr:hypothetical protein [Gammaproteobacteria bacterium]